MEWEGVRSERELVADRRQLLPACLCMCWPARCSSAPAAAVTRLSPGTQSGCCGTCPYCRLNAAEMYIDVTAGEEGSGSQWIAESGVLDLFILLVRAAWWWLS